MTFCKQQHAMFELLSFFMKLIRLKLLMYYYKTSRMYGIGTQTEIKESDQNNENINK